MATQLDLLVTLYENGLEAEQVLLDLQDLERGGKVRVVDAAVLTREEGKRPRIRELNDLRWQDGRSFGALVGAIMGLAGGPAGAFVGAAAGAVAGGVVAGGVDAGIRDKYLKVVLDKLEPGMSALVIIIEHRWWEDVEAAVSAHDAEIHRYSLGLSIERPEDI